MCTFHISFTVFVSITQLFSWDYDIVFCIDLLNIKIQNILLLVSFDIKFIRKSEWYRNGMTCFWLSLIYFISKDTYMVFYLSCIILQMLRHKECQVNEK